MGAGAASPRVWIVTDGKAGDEQPLLGIAEAMGVTADVRRIRPRVPFALLMPHGPVDPRERPGRSGGPLAGPFPDICLAAGRRAVASLRALKAASPATLTVFYRDPRTARHGADLLVVQAHDGLPAGPGVLTVVTGPHRMAAARLEALRADPPPALRALARPRVAVLVGGDSRRHRFSPGDADRLMAGLERLRAAGAGLMVTASRRTPPALASRLADLAGQGAVVWDGRGDNPLAAYLALADAVVVTADSTNMIGEAVATGRPVQVFHPSGGHARTGRFLKALEEIADVRLFDGEPAGEPYPPVDSTPLVAARILALWQDRIR